MPWWGWLLIGLVSGGVLIYVVLSIYLRNSFRSFL